MFIAELTVVGQVRGLQELAEMQLRFFCPFVVNRYGKRQKATYD